MGTATVVYDLNQFYTLGSTLIVTGLLRKAEAFFLFPPMSIVVATTVFTDGAKHLTVNRPAYRALPENGTRTYVPAEKGVEAILIEHEAAVRRLIDRGKRPAAAPSTVDGVLAAMRQENEQDRERWKTVPYSWSDALHQSFKWPRPNAM